MTINDADINVCSKALQLIGADEITSFDDETREARLCAKWYPTLKRSTLQKHYWRFSIRQEQLSKLSSTPLYGYAFAYQIPTDFLRFVGKQNPSINHQIFENKLYTDADPLYISMQYEVNAQYFPAYFEYLLALETAKVLAFGLLEDDSKTTNLESLIRAQLIQARAIDSQNNSASIIPQELLSLTSIRN
jgi:hypothetical protein